MSNPQLLVSRLAALQTVAVGLDRMGLNSSVIISRKFPELDQTDPNAAKIPSLAIYRLVEECARDTGDRYFGCKLANAMTQEITSYYGLQYSGDTTLAEVLVQQNLAQEKVEAPIPIKIMVDTKGASVILKRSAFAPKQTAQTDAWSITAVCNAISRVIGKHWDPRKISILLPEPDTILPELAPPSVINAWQHSGFKLTFPVEWLALKQGSTEPMPNANYATRNGEFAHALKAVLRPMLGDPQLTLSKTAHYCGIDTRQLQTNLARENTTFNDVRASLKREFAEEQLAAGLIEIAAISEALGYSDVSAFSRAFKIWTGISPDRFRKQQGTKPPCWIPP